MSVFVDTTILVSAHDREAARHVVANRLVRELWQLPVLPVISVQVCRELWRALSRSSDLERDVLVQLVQSYLKWRVVPEDGDLVAAAFELRVTLMKDILKNLIFNQSVTHNSKYAIVALA